MNAVPSAAIPPEPGGLPTRRNDVRSVLVVEDETTARVALRSLLQAEGYRVLEAETGAEAIETAIASRPDIILMDLGLPELNGLDAALHLSRLPDTRSIPVLAITASWLGTRCEILHSHGFCGAVLKPVEPRRLLHELGRVLAEGRIEL